MGNQLVFIIITALTIGIFSFSIYRIFSFMKFTQAGYPIRDIKQRIKITLNVALGQTKIMRLPVIGLMHALVFWGFVVISIGTTEIVIDGIFGTHRIFSVTAGFYKFITASGEIFAALIIFSCLAFLLRRHLLRVKRFSGQEMTTGSSLDATIALTLIILLMVSLLGMNLGYVLSAPSALVGMYPVSNSIASMMAGWQNSAAEIEIINWWTHVMLVFVFANILPYSKHFHVFMSVPNVFMSRLEPLTKLSNMETVTQEVKLMMNPDTAFANPPEGNQEAPSRFGVKDVEDASWNNYVDSLTCTECGRCTAVCPANITGKKLSPRKIFVDYRKRMSEKGPGLVKEGKDFTDNKSLLGDYITAEELWACTTCNACAQECPVNIDHVSLIVDMRRYMVMEESSAPAQLNNMFANIENNGAPWPFAQTERFNWANDLYINTGKQN